ncbi:MAG: hypothetical protein JSR59_14455, partial [Proteobacteria bacterium]|nr:hypothetical protein [Pseudomonadota bacterium]
MQRSPDPDCGLVHHARGGRARAIPKRRWSLASAGCRLVPTALALAALPLAIAQAYGEEVTATWIGASGGSYGSPASWDIGAVPLNNGDQTYIVDIGSNFTVNYSVAGAQAIDALSLGKSFFALSSSDPMNRSVLTVLDAATIGGSISATGASFIATGAGTSFVGNTSTLAALGGGVVRIAAPSFDASGLNAATILNASGAGSLIDLSSVKTFNAGSSGPNGNSIVASNGGSIDLSGVTALTAPANAAALTFNLSGASNVDLSSLQTVGGVTTDTGYTNFVLDGSSATVGPLQKANRLGVTLKDGSTMTLGGYGGSATVTNSGFVVSGGSKLDAST